MILERLLAHPLNQRLKLLGDGGLASLGRVCVTVDAEALFGHVLELLALELREGGDGVLVDGLGEVEDLVALLQQTLNERRLLNLLLAVA